MRHFVCTKRSFTVASCPHVRAISIAVVALALAASLGCGGDDGSSVPSCDDDACFAPTAAQCDGNTMVTFGPGTCGPDGCDRSEARTVCGDRCEDGACVGDNDEPCALDACPLAAPTCAGTVASVPGAAISCTDDGTCTYGEPTLEDCALSNQICRAGSCVDRESCEGVTCDAPPLDRCESGSTGEAESVAVRFAANGECTNGQCTYATAVEDCALRDLTCEEGACVGADLCDDVVCDAPPAPHCDGGEIVTYDGVGSCDAVTGACTYSPSRDACDPELETCIDAACVATVACTAERCDAPPEDSCDGLVARVHDLAPVCTDDTCVYPHRAVDCAVLGEICIDGACVEGDPCDVLTCDDVPAPRCNGEIYVESLSGSCASGSCTYPTSDTDCAAVDFTCTTDGCVDLCADVTCERPPDACDASGRAIAVIGDGACELGVCNFTTTTDDCPIAGGFCEDGACVFVDPCEGVVCQTPPDDSCEQRTAIQYDAEGVCVGGPCRYTSRRVDCGGAGQYCFDGACVDEDPCPFITCGDAPSPACDGTFSLRYSGEGTCADGFCSWPTSVVDCGAGGGTCDAGACVGGDVCAAIGCVDPPAPRCDGDVSTRFLDPALCTLDTCVWPPTVTDCDLAPTPRCEGTLAIAPSSGGVCQAGVCEYEGGITDCALLGRDCVEGACVEAPSCETLDCTTAPPPECDGDLRYIYTGPGGCFDGACNFTRVLTNNCAVDDQVCRDGSCVAPNICDDVTCDACPLAYCLDSIAMQPECPGSCAGGVCSYPFAAAQDCAATGERCLDGACVDADLCAGIVCEDTPEPECDGDGLITYLPGGECALGSCIYDIEVFRCDSIPGGFCSDGACDAIDPCLSIECDERAPTCATDSALRVYDPVCEFGGVCGFDESIVPCDPNTFCHEGACLDLALCPGIRCTEAPEPVCLTSDPNVAVRDDFPVSCDDVGCNWTTTITDCALTDQICQQGVCVGAIPPVADELQFNEFVADTPGGNPLLQWFEIANTTDRTIALDGVTIVDASDNVLSAPAGASIGADSQLLFAASSEPFASGINPIVWAAPFGLSRPTGSLELRHGATVINRIAWDATWPIAAGGSTSLDPDSLGGDNSLPAVWCTIASPTPQLENPTCPIVPSDPPLLGDLVIAELHPRPAAGANAFFEVVNVSGRSLQVDDLVFSDGGAQSVALGPRAPLSPNARLLIASSDTLAGTDVVWPALPTGSAGTINVRLGATLLDAVTWTTEWPTSVGRSLVHCDASDPADNDVPSAWIVAWIPFSEDSYGSPGQIGSDCATTFQGCDDDVECGVSTSQCEGDAQYSRANGTCMDGQCVYDASSEDREATWCPSLGQSCRDGECGD